MIPDSRRPSSILRVPACPGPCPCSLGPSAAAHYSLAWIIGDGHNSAPPNPPWWSRRQPIHPPSGTAVFSPSRICSCSPPRRGPHPRGSALRSVAFGRGYAMADVTVLRLIALSALPAIITNTAVTLTALSGVCRRMVVWIQLCIFALGVGG